MENKKIRKDAREAQALNDEELDAVSGGKSVVIQNAYAPTLGDLLGDGQMGGQFAIDKDSPLGGM